MDTPVKAKPKMKLYGFNNLTKTLSFNIYDICYTRTEEEKKQYIQYIDEVYNAERLTKKMWLCIWINPILQFIRTLKAIRTRGLVHSAPISKCLHVVKSLR